MAVTPADVRALIETTLTDEQLEVVIADAALLVANCIAGLPPEVADAIVKYVAADMLVTLSTRGRGTITSKSVGDASESYGSSTAAFGQSAFWARALQFDPRGCLNRLGKSRASLAKV